MKTTPENHRKGLEKAAERGVNWLTMSGPDWLRLGLDLDGISTGRIAQTLQQVDLRRGCLNAQAVTAAERILERVSVRAELELPHPHASARETLRITSLAGALCAVYDEGRLKVA